MSRLLAIGLAALLLSAPLFAQESVARALRYHALARRHVDGKVDPQHIADDPPLVAEK